MATLCLAMPGLRPRDYWELTLAERDALMRTYIKINKK